jgi:hypothetical protein
MRKSIKKTPFLNKETGVFWRRLANFTGYGKYYGITEESEKEKALRCCLI